MKKINFIAVAVAAVSIFASCDKDQVIPEEKTITKITVDLKIDDLSPDTKALKQDWEDGDKINIWFNDVSSPNYSYWKQAPHLVLTRSAGAWVSSEVDETLLASSGTFNAVYESSNALFNSAIDNARAFFPEVTPFKFHDLTSNTKTRKLPLVVLKNDVSYTYDSGTKKISGTISGWYFETRLQVVISGLTYTADRYALTFSSGIQYFDNLFWWNNNISSSGIAYCTGLTDIYFMDAMANSDGIAFYFKNPTSSAATDYTIYLVDKVDKKVYCFTKNAEIATTYTSCKSIKIAFSNFTDCTTSNPID